MSEKKTCKMEIQGVKKSLIIILLIVAVLLSFSIVYMTSQAKDLQDMLATDYIRFTEIPDIEPAKATGIEDRLSFPITYREIWIPEATSNTDVIGSAEYGGHQMALFNAKKRTTCDGVYFDNLSKSNVNFGEIYSDVSTLTVYGRFMLDTTHEAGSGTHHIVGKYLDTNDAWMVYLSNATGKLTLYMQTEGVTGAFLTSARDSWQSGKWYNFIASISANDSQRLIVDGESPITSSLSSVPTPDGGDFVLGDTGLGTGFLGTVSKLALFTEDLTATEEQELMKGIYPLDKLSNQWLFDEGMGDTVYDRSGNGYSGLLSRDAHWQWGQVRQPMFSLDGHSAFMQSSLGADITGNVTIVWAGKLQSTYETVERSHFLISYFVDMGNYIFLTGSQNTDGMRFGARGQWTIDWIDYETTHEIGDYAVFVGTVSETGALAFYANGQLIGTAQAEPLVGRAICVIGNDECLTPFYYDVSSPMLLGIIDGVLTESQVIEYTQAIRSEFNYP